MNLGCALFGVYPNFCFGISFLATMEVGRIMDELSDHQKNKEKELKKADKLKEEAERNLDG